MNYAKAVKGPSVGNDLVVAIQEYALLELKRTQTREELSLMNKKYSFQEILNNGRKV